MRNRRNFLSRFLVAPVFLIFLLSCSAPNTSNSSESENTSQSGRKTALLEVAQQSSVFGEVEALFATSQEQLMLDEALLHTTDLDDGKIETLFIPSVSGSYQLGFTFNAGRVDEAFLVETTRVGNSFETKYVDLIYSEVSEMKLDQNLQQIGPTRTGATLRKSSLQELTQIDAPLQKEVQEQKLADFYEREGTDPP